MTASLTDAEILAKAEHDWDALRASSIRRGTTRPQPAWADLDLETRAVWLSCIRDLFESKPLTCCAAKPCPGTPGATT